MVARAPSFAALCACALGGASCYAMGGAAEMAFMGERFGAQAERVALAQSLRSAPRYVAAVTATIIGALALSAAFAVALARLSDVAAPTMVLATPPGGITEMRITANALQLGVPLVTVAHVTRVIILVTRGGAALPFNAGDCRQGRSILSAPRQARFGRRSFLLESRAKACTPQLCGLSNR
jgi:uncharacterized membrane protein AbrB (regulator of aidB expression)